MEKPDSELAKERTSFKYGIEYGFLIAIAKIFDLKLKDVGAK